MKEILLRDTPASDPAMCEGAFNQNESMLGVFLDMRKAFDTIDYTIHLNKLNRYGIRGSALQLIRNYLTNRNQYVSYNGTESAMLLVTCGVPEGSILGAPPFPVIICKVQLWLNANIQLILI